MEKNQNPSNAAEDVDRPSNKRQHHPGDSNRKGSAEALRAVRRQQNIQKRRNKMKFPRKTCILCCSSSCLGPAPIYCKSCLCCSSNRPTQTASVTTKLAYLIALGVVTVLACFFTIPYPESFTKGKIKFWPCLDENSEYIEFGGWWGNCRGHAGYFMVYRIFFAAIIIFTLLALLLIKVDSTEDTCRPGLHQGYWLWKGLFFVFLLFVAFFGISVSKAAFEEAMMIMGLISAFLFAFPTLVFLLDVCELIIIKLKTSWSYCRCLDTHGWKVPYWCLTFLVYVFDLIMLVVLGTFYTSRSTGIDEEIDNVQAVYYNKGGYCTVNILLIIYCIGVGVLTSGVALLHVLRKYPIYPHSGFLQAAVVTGHTIMSIYLALGNSAEVECRVVWYPYVATPDIQDVTLTLEGLVYSTFVWITLGYFTLGRGPKTETAPLSIIFMQVLQILNVRQIESIRRESTAPDKANKTLKDNESESESESTMSNIEIDPYLDETAEVNYSWTFFHLFLILGSFSMMMGITNFIRPIADGPNASNSPAFVVKFLMSPFGVLLFVVPLVLTIFKIAPVTPQTNNPELVDQNDEESNLNLPEPSQAPTERTLLDKNVSAEAAMIPSEKAEAAKKSSAKSESYKKSGKSEAAKQVSEQTRTPSILKESKVKINV